MGSVSSDFELVLKNRRNERLDLGLDYRCIYIKGVFL